MKFVDHTIFWRKIHTYSLDLASCDYFEFPSSKEIARRIKIWLHEEYIAISNANFKDLDRSYYFEGFKKLEKRRTMYVELKGTYFGKQKVHFYHILWELWLILYLDWERTYKQFFYFYEEYCLECRWLSFLIADISETVWGGPVFWAFKDSAYNFLWDFDDFWCFKD